MLKSFIVVIGVVGSGKFILFLVIVGELLNVSGIIFFGGMFVYVFQKVWVFYGIIRENILFGQFYDEIRYVRIIEVCVFVEDIVRFFNGD